jgi:lipopolysaccharide transport system ATP-binding protein
LDSEVVLSAHNISKKYYNKKDGLFAKEENVFWALRDVSFEVKKGQILGIIGPNGAGKSTILKILSEVIPPTNGHIEYRGNMLSILDIGTGFHPDLSGYDNIFLNASILGMKKSETATKVDEIITFSGIGNFINEPVKNYSNGMYLRLALSIALFTDYEIILLDEVISVGDAEFRYKAVQKIKEQVQEGRTCIMISHDLGSVLSLCDYCILLEKGEIIYSGKSKDTVEDYFKKVYNTLAVEKVPVLDHEKCRLISVEPAKKSFFMDEQIGLKIKFEKKVAEDIDIVLKIRSYSSNVMSDCEIYRPEYKEKNLAPGIYETECIIPANIFNTGTYIIDIILGDKISILVEYPFANKFIVDLKEWEKNKKWNEANEAIPFRPICDWKTVKVA